MDAAGWDARYAGADLVWSAGPNVWVRELCTPMPPGRALDVAAGEGRNALWLVEQGWTVVAADFSAVGVERMNEIADRRLTQRRSAFTAVVADATQPAPRPPSDLWSMQGRWGGEAGAVRPGADLLPAPAAHRVGRGPRGRGARDHRRRGRARRGPRRAQPHRGRRRPARTPRSCSTPRTSSRRRPSCRSTSSWPSCGPATWRGPTGRRSTPWCSSGCAPRPDPAAPTGQPRRRARRGCACGHSPPVNTPAGIASEVSSRFLGVGPGGLSGRPCRRPARGRPAERPTRAQRAGSTSTIPVDGSRPHRHEGLAGRREPERLAGREQVAEVEPPAGHVVEQRRRSRRPPCRGCRARRAPSR